MKHVKTPMQDTATQDPAATTRSAKAIIAGWILLMLIWLCALLPTELLESLDALLFTMYLASLLLAIYGVTHGRAIAGTVLLAVVVVISPIVIAIFMFFFRGWGSVF
jgi:hypothetical protein